MIHGSMMMSANGVEGGLLNIQNKFVAQLLQQGSLVGQETGPANGILLSVIRPYATNLLKAWMMKT
jgi:hypothetical protein